MQNVAGERALFRRVRVSDKDADLLRALLIPSPASTIRLQSTRAVNVSVVPTSTGGK
jgi:hypothetical protein